MKTRSTTILTVRHHGTVAIGGDGQVSLGSTIMKADAMKIRNGETKWILRRAMDGILPPKVRDRQDKVGFSTPEDAWFRNEFREMTEELFDSESFRSRACYDHERIREDLESHLAGKRNRSGHLWRHVNTELWFREFIDRDA